MRWGVLLVGLLTMSAAFVGGLDANAQQVSPDASDGGADSQAAPGPGPLRHMQGWPAALRHADFSATGLVFTPPDRALSQADVQKIAEAWLVWHGNHAWRVTNLASDADRVTFAIATAANAVVATFTMNRHTGVLARIG